jgi:3',5'-cyclic AMP phosphodiesterase CpdA
MMNRERLRSVPATATLAVLAVLTTVAARQSPLPPPLPAQPDAVRFAVIGDSGTGGKDQYTVAERLADCREQFPFEFVIMLGDNMYGSKQLEDFVRKFERPYRRLIEAGVEFYATLGNHDNPQEVYYKPFNMNGHRYYTFTRGPIEFFVLDSNYMDPKQLAWLEQQLDESGRRWKIAYFHHPLYSSGSAHGSETDLRTLVEPLFIRFGVDVVFSGHEHFYERVKPQNGIAYFIEGGSAKLRRGNIRKTDLTAKGFDTDRSFMLVQVAGDELQFQTISRLGQLVDSGTVDRSPDQDNHVRLRPDAAQTTRE